MRLFLFISTFLLFFVSILTSISADDSLVLKINTDKEKYEPGERILINANLTKDGVPLISNITFQVDDPKGNTILILTKPTNENGTATITLRLSYDAVAGTYKVYGSAYITNETKVASSRSVVVKEPTKTVGISLKTKENVFIILFIIVIIVLTIAYLIAKVKRK